MHPGGVPECRGASLSSAPLGRTAFLQRTPGFHPGLISVKPPDCRAGKSFGDRANELDLAPWEAVLGAEVVVATLDGSIKLRIPACAENGRKMRVRGRGLPKGKSERGDFFVILNVVLPPAPSDEERALWEKLRDTSTFLPRPARPTQPTTP